MGRSEIDLLAVTTRAIAFAAIVVLTGAVAFHWTVLRRWMRNGAVVPDRPAGIAARAGAWGAATLILVSPARLFAQARALVDVGDPVLPMMGNVLKTLWGRGLLLQGIAAAAAFAGFLLARRGWSAGRWIALASALTLTATPALMGHAAAAERYVPLSLLADWVHVTAACVWVGTLGLLALTVHGLERSAANGSLAAKMIELFHPVALVSAATLLASGVVSLLMRVPHLGDLLHSPYGAILAIKLLLTAGVATLGFHHSRHGARLARDYGPRVLFRTLVAETALAAAVIIATAVLVGTAPPMAGMEMGGPRGESTTLQVTSNSSATQDPRSANP